MASETEDLIQKQLTDITAYIRHIRNALSQKNPGTKEAINHAARQIQKAATTIKSNVNSLPEA